MIFVLGKITANLLHHLHGDIFYVTWIIYEAIHFAMAMQLLKTAEYNKPNT